MTGAGAGARVAGSEVEALRGKQKKRLRSYKKSGDFRLKRLTGAINRMAVGYKTTFSKRLKHEWNLPNLPFQKGHRLQVYES